MGLLDRLRALLGMVPSASPEQEMLSALVEQCKKIEGELRPRCATLAEEQASLAKESARLRATYESLSREALDSLERGDQEVLTGFLRARGATRKSYQQAENSRLERAEQLQEAARSLQRIETHRTRIENLIERSKRAIPVGTLVHFAPLDDSEALETFARMEAKLQALESGAPPSTRPLAPITKTTPEELRLLALEEGHRAREG